MRSRSHSAADSVRASTRITSKPVAWRMAGFGARILNPDDFPKFMNSPETLLFSKSRILYGDRLVAGATILRFFVEEDVEKK